MNYFPKDRYNPELMLSRFEDSEIKACVGDYYNSFVANVQVKYQAWPSKTHPSSAVHKTLHTGNQLETAHLHSSPCGSG